MYLFITIDIFYQIDIRKIQKNQKKIINKNNNTKFWKLWHRKQKSF
jgi:hypothetical protein